MVGSFPVTPRGVKVHLSHPSWHRMPFDCRRRTSWVVRRCFEKRSGAVRLSNPGHSSGPWDSALAEKGIDVVTWCMRLFLKQASGVGPHPRFANTSSSDLALI